MAWAAAMDLREAFKVVSGRSRHDLLRAAWTCLLAVDRSLLGPARGEDLSLLVIAEDEGGVGVTATGLAALHGLLGGGLEGIVPAAHPLLSLSGIPEAPPRVLTPTRIPDVFIGATREGSLPLDEAGWALACGLREV